MCSARCTVCGARCTVYGAARQLRRDRERGDTEIRGARMVQHCVQPVKNVKQVLCTKSAYRFWARPYVTNSTRKCANNLQAARRTPYTVHLLWAVCGARCMVYGVRCATHGVRRGALIVARSRVRQCGNRRCTNGSTLRSNRPNSETRFVHQKCVPILGKTLRYK